MVAVFSSTESSNSLCNSKEEIIEAMSILPSSLGTVAAEPAGVRQKQHYINHGETPSSQWLLLRGLPAKEQPGSWLFNCHPGAQNAGTSLRRQRGLVTRGVVCK